MPTPRNFPRTAMMSMDTGKDMAGMATMPKKKAPPVLSLQRLGYGLEMIGALGNTGDCGFCWQRGERYEAPVFTYPISKNWTLHVEPSFGLSDVSDPFV